MMFGLKRMYRVVLVAVLICAVPVLAQANDLPDLRGTWAGKYRAIVFGDGKVTIGEETTTLVIDQQDAEAFSGAAVWQMEEGFSGTSDIGKEQKTGGRDAFIGIIGLNGSDLTMAEGKDTGIYRGHVIDADHIMLTYIESDLGDAVLLRAIFTRQP
jgi:hypothetical protein